MNKIKQIYNILLEAYKEQGWWPLSGVEKNQNLGKSDKDYPNYQNTNPSGSKEDFLKNWPRHHGLAPNTDKHRFEIMMGAILTQNTGWINVEKALYNLNKAGLNTLESIKITSQEQIGQLIRPAGYFNQKSDRIKLLAEFLSQFDSIRQFFHIEKKELRTKLLDLKGIGPETADSIILYAAGKPSFVIDAYSKRIFSRIGICATDVDYYDLQDIFYNNLAKDTETFKQYHALIVEHAKRHCKTKPICANCPLALLCNKSI